MNCMEAQALVDDALDASLAGKRKRALELHLSRCDACRAFFAYEREERRRWFQAMNDPDARRCLPAGFAAGFLETMSAKHAMPQRKWAFLRVFRRIAAALAAMLLFSVFAYAAGKAVEIAVVAPDNGKDALAADAGIFPEVHREVQGLSAAGPLARAERSSYHARP